MLTIWILQCHKTKYGKSLEVQVDTIKAFGGKHNLSIFLVPPYLLLTLNTVESPKLTPTNLL